MYKKTNPATLYLSLEIHKINVLLLRVLLAINPYIFAKSFHNIVTKALDKNNSFV